MPEEAEPARPLKGSSKLSGGPLFLSRRPKGVCSRLSNMGTAKIAKACNADNHCRYGHHLGQDRVDRRQQRDIRSADSGRTVTCVTTIIVI